MPSMTFVQVENPNWEIIEQTWIWMYHLRNNPPNLPQNNNNTKSRSWYHKFKNLCHKFVKFHFGQGYTFSFKIWTENIGGRHVFTSLHIIASHNLLHHVHFTQEENVGNLKDNGGVGKGRFLGKVTQSLDLKAKGMGRRENDALWYMGGCPRLYLIPFSSLPSLILF